MKELDRREMMKKTGYAVAAFAAGLTVSVRKTHAGDEWVVTPTPGQNFNSGGNIVGATDVVAKFEVILNSEFESWASGEVSDAGGQFIVTPTSTPTPSPTPTPTTPPTEQQTEEDPNHEETDGWFRRLLREWFGV